MTLALWYCNITPSPNSQEGKTHSWSSPERPKERKLPPLFILVDRALLTPTERDNVGRKLATKRQMTPNKLVVDFNTSRSVRYKAL